MGGHAVTTYTIEFLRPAGCPRAIVEDMARYDGARITAYSGDERTEDGHVRDVTLEFKRGQRPTMARWASFMVGARLL